MSFEPIQVDLRRRVTTADLNYAVRDTKHGKKVLVMNVSRAAMASFREVKSVRLEIGSGTDAGTARLACFVSKNHDVDTRNLQIRVGNKYKAEWPYGDALAAVFPEVKSVHVLQITGTTSTGVIFQLPQSTTDRKKK